MTDLEGKVCEVVDIDSAPQSVTLRDGSNRHEFTKAPNQVQQIDGRKVKVLRTAPFDYPYHPKQPQ
ncbi:MAG: hypothetical protein NTU80_08375 [Verrucomicrobia bacterium]|nr:hypothetical protein [Verrucomicrobiota bacterium]